MPTWNQATPIRAVATSSDPDITAFQALFQNGSHRAWASNNITYSFPAGGSRFVSGYGNGEIAAGWTPFNEMQQLFVTSILKEIESYTNLRFSLVADGDTVGDLRFGFTSKFTGSDEGAGVQGGAYQPSNTPEGGDVWLGYKFAGANFGTGNIYQSVAHEIGHALGLSHPFTSAGETHATAALVGDSNVTTLMSYNNVVFPKSFARLDIAALQYLYGTNNSTHTDNNEYPFIVWSGASLVKTAWDAGGIDTLVALLGPLQSSGARINLRIDGADGASAGTLTDVPAFFTAKGVTIENARGTIYGDVFYGNPANNTLWGLGGADTVDGDAGIDTFVLPSSRASYAITSSADLSRQGFDLAIRRIKLDPGQSASNLDLDQNKVKSVERIQFTDGTLALDISGNAGQAYRLYQAAFNRTPDQSGLGYQIQALDTGLTLTQVAQNFLNSPEFAKTYGGLDDSKFVTQLYINVLHRPGESAGLAYHVNDLAHGAQRATILANFSESPENQAALIGVIGAGIFYPT